MLAKQTLCAISLLSLKELTAYLQATKKEHAHDLDLLLRGLLQLVQ